MNTPDYSEGQSGQDPLFPLKLETGRILSGITSLLGRDAVQDQTDRRLLMDAVAFIENPTENLGDIMNHTTNMGVVMGGYEMQGADIPTEIYAMNAYLVALQCIHCIHFVEAELERKVIIPAQIQEAMAMALDMATILSEGWAQDDTLLRAVHALEARL